MACVKAIIQQLESEHLMLNALPPVQIMCVILGVCMCRCFYHRLVIQSTFDLDGVQGIYKNYTSSGPVRPVVAALILLLDRVVPVAWPVGWSMWGPCGLLRTPFRGRAHSQLPVQGSAWGRASHGGQARRNPPSRGRARRCRLSRVGQDRCGTLMSRANPDTWPFILYSEVCLILIPDNMSIVANYDTLYIFYRGI